MGPLTERVCVIVNPTAGRGRGARLLPDIEKAFAAHGVTDVRASSGAGDERRLAREAITEGFTTIVGVGGDGTTGNIANEILRSGGDIRLCVIPAGTGNDFSKTLGTDGTSLDDVAGRAAGSDDTRVDVGRIEDRFFLNSCGFGFDVAVLQALAATPWLPGNAVYLYTALRQLFRFPGLHVAVESSASRRARSLHMMTVIANVPHFGGAFVIAPDAVVTDGELDAVTVLDARAGRRLSMLAAATRGTHALYREVIMERAPEFHIAFDEPPFYETDGEVHRAASATITVRCVPSALRVVTGDGGLRVGARRSAPLVQRQP